MVFGLGCHDHKDDDRKDYNDKKHDMRDDYSKGSNREGSKFSSNRDDFESSNRDK